LDERGDSMDAELWWCSMESGTSTSMSSSDVCRCALDGRVDERWPSAANRFLNVGERLAAPGGVGDGGFGVVGRLIVGWLVEHMLRLRHAPTFLRTHPPPPLAGMPPHADES
tara:strand:- start:2083 stop:2418 length:336 start_codon:yes stop_codon:yes gene_type:complete